MLSIPYFLRMVRDAMGIGFGLFRGHKQRQLIRNSTGGRRYSSDSIPRINGNCQGLLDSVDVFIFDCDGVIWKGDVAIEGATRVLDRLRALNKRVFFVTNNSTKSRKGFISKFTSLGIHVNPQGRYIAPCVF